MTYKIYILTLGFFISSIPFICAQQVKVIDHKGTLKNVTSNKVTTSTTAPTTPIESDIWFDTSTNGTKVWDGTSWKAILASSAQKLWDTDTDTGIQVEESADEDKIRFDTAGAERMIIDESGNVGIGTTNPEYLLQVANRFGFKNDGVFYWGQDARSVADTQKGVLSWNGTDNNVIVGAASTNTGVSFLAGNTEKARITANGNFGIGTTAPSEKLHVAGGIRVENLATGTSTDYLVVVDANGVFKKIQPSSSSSGSSPWYGSDDNQPATTNTENIYSMGNVGIGTNNPGFDLDINGTVRLQNSGYIQSYSVCANPGEIRFNGDRFYGCVFAGSNLSKWHPL